MIIMLTINVVNLYIFQDGIANRPSSQVPKCACPISHNAPEMRTKWCVVGYVAGAFWDL